MHGCTFVFSDFVYVQNMRKSLCLCECPCLGYYLLHKMGAHVLLLPLPSQLCSNQRNRQLEVEVKSLSISLQEAHARDSEQICYTILYMHMTWSKRSVFY